MADFPRASPAKWWKTTSIGRVHRSPHTMFISRVRWSLSIVALLALMLLIGGVWYLTNPKRLSAMSGLLLSHVLGAHVHVQNAQLSWTGSLRLTGVRLQTNPGKMPSTTLFSADQFEVQFNWLGLISGRLHATHITAIRPMFNLVDDLDVGQWNYERFARSAGPTTATANKNNPPSSPDKRVARLPAIDLHSALVQWGEIQHGHYRVIGQSLINAELGPSSQSHSTYKLSMEQQTMSGRQGIILSGLYNISTRAFSARVNHLDFTSEFRRTLPAPVQKLWKKLHLRGGVRNIVFQVSPGNGLQMQSELDDVSIQTVAPSRRLGPQVIAFKNLYGNIAITNNGFQINHLHGSVLGWNFQVPDARFDGYQSGAPFHLNLILPDVNIPQPYPKIFSTRDFVVAQSIFDILRPSGLLSLTLHVDRTNLNGDPVINGEIQCKNVRARYVNFPYPMRHVHGLIRFTAHHIEFESVRATAETFPVLLRGRVAINENDGPINLTISCPHAYFDRRLAASLPVNIRPIWDRFNPVGAGAFVCDVTHAAGAPGDPNIVLHIFPQDVSGAYRDLPYPLHHVHGTLIFTDHEAKIIKLEAPVGINGDIVFTGTVAYSPDDLSKLKPMVRLQATDVPITPVLIGSLPGSWARWINTLHVQSGLAGIDAMITRGQAGEPAVSGILNIQDGTMKPPRIPWAITHVTATAHLASGGFTISSLTGQTGADGKGAIAISGAIVEPANGPIQVGADGSWKNIQIADQAPADTLASLAHFWNAWQVRGRSDGSFTYSIQADQTRLTGATVLKNQIYHVQIEPLGMQVSPAFFPQPLSAITGEVDLTNNLIRLKKVHALSGSVQLLASGAYQTAADALALNLHAGGTHLPVHWMAMIPGSTLGFLHQLSPTAAWALDLPTLQRSKVGKSYRWRFTGSLVLNDLMTAGVIKLKARQATLTVAGDLAPGASFPMLAGQFGVTHLNWEGKIMDPLTGDITADASTHLISIDKINGTVAGGTLTGNIHIHTGKIGSYAVACKLSNAQLAGLLRSPATTQSAAGIRTSTGIVNASLILNATLGKNKSRQGSGRLIISQAGIYDVPMAMGLMQIATLRLPVSSEFKHADVHYTIHDNTVQFNPISLRSPGVNLVGEGTLNLKTTDLNLRLLTQSPEGTRIPLLGYLFGLARSQLLELRVSGPVAHPVITPIPLRFLAWPFIGFGQ